MTATLLTAWRAARDRLIAAGVDSPVLDARMLLERATGVARIEILTDPYRPVPPEAEAALEALLARREAREPISHILGRKPFWTFDLEVTPHVLTPRPETEFLVQAGLELLAPDKPARILDLGVGSGAILFALLRERPFASGIGVDQSPAALAVAARNARALGLESRVELLEGDWAAGIAGPFDLIVSNPPYIPTGDIAGLAPEVARHEPRAALDGGADGLDAYRALAPQIASVLGPRGSFLLEIGAGQGPGVEALLAPVGLEAQGFKADLAGYDRVLIGRKRA